MTITPSTTTFYRTRGGKKMRVYATDAGGPYPTHTAAQDQKSGEWKFMALTKDGFYHDAATPSPNDLIAIWIDLPIWPEGVAAGYDWVAMDEDGEWFAFTSKPEAIGDEWLSNRSIHRILPSHVPAFTGDWRESRIERPTGKA